MQEQINKKRFFLLVLLTVVTVGVGWWVQPENRLDIDRHVFQVEKLDEISKVELTSPGTSVYLAYDGRQWRVNEQFNADAGMIRVLFATLRQAQAKRRVAAAGQDSLFHALAESGVKVSLYAGETLRKTFFAGGNPAKTLAFFADPETQEVYVMTIPGYRVYVSGILELGVNGWRDKFVFGFNWRNFARLEVRFPEKTAEGFTVSMQKDFFAVEGLPETDTAKLNTFLDNVSLLTVEEYLSELKLTDSLKETIPKMEIVVSDIANRNYRLRLFDPGKSRKGYGLVQDSQAVLFDRRKIEALLKPRSFFRKK